MIACSVALPYIGGRKERGSQIGIVQSGGTANVVVQKS